MFTNSQTYDRNDLLTFVGSKQRQSGIIWGNNEPTCIIVTSGGRGGKSLGYSDEKNKDGSIYYIGQGGKGDQNPNQSANSLLIQGNRSVLFFSTSEPNAAEVKVAGNYRKKYKFEGLFEVASWTFSVARSGRRKGEKLIQFLLVPANNIFNIPPYTMSLNSDDDFKRTSLEFLRRKILESNNKPQQGGINLIEYRRRSRDVVAYAKKRARGNCENCSHKAPFLDIANEPFLEVHHIFRLADDGPDEPQNVAAICPNCHREAHYGIDKEKIKTQLTKIIIDKEQQLSKSLSGETIKNY